MRKRKYFSLLQDPKTYDQAIPCPTIHNIVATSQIEFHSHHLDLDLIHSIFPFSFYDRKKFAAITLRLHNPECTTLLFSSGKVVVTGCKAWYECIYASLFIASLLQESLPENSFQLVGCDIQNMVAHVELPVGPGGYLDITAMYQRMPLNCTYQHKLFPGLIYRHDRSPVVLLCFHSGKIVITGGKNMEDVYMGWNLLWPIIRTFIVHAEGQGGVKQSFALEGDSIADNATGIPQRVVKSARGYARRMQLSDLLDAAKL
jgi:transcription initiation factor TFIID TATA-box-binding protein